MRLRSKVLIGVGILGILLVGIPFGVAVASGKSEALQGLVETYKYIFKSHVETIKGLLDAYVKFLGAL